MENLLIFIFGAAFGVLIQYAHLNRYDVISRQSTLKDNTVLKTILLAVGLGAVLLSPAIGAGLAGFHVKPFVTGGIIIGGLVFGAGMAVLGYCPGTLAVSLGEGSVDALIGVLGGFTGGLFYTLLLPSLQGILGPNLGKISLYSIFGTFSTAYFLSTIIIGAVIVYSAFLIHKKSGSGSGKWILTGIGLAVLNTIVFLKFTTNRPIGASTSFPYMADILTNTVDNPYFEKIQTPGHWEVIFLLGAMVAAFVVSVIKKEFDFVLIHDNWKYQKGESVQKRVFWAFAGGFILIFGARMAGGCTSGHIISGGMQLAFSSLTFGVFMFAGLLITGKLFYKKP